MRMDSLDLFDTTKSVIHDHDEVRKISNMVKSGHHFAEAASSPQRISVESFPDHSASHWLWIQSVSGWVAPVLTEIAR